MHPLGLLRATHMVLLTHRTDSRVSFCQQANLLSTNTGVKGWGGRDTRVKVVSSLAQSKSEVEAEAEFAPARWVCCLPPPADMALSTGGRAPLVSMAVRLGMGGGLQEIHSVCGEQPFIQILI